ncbi:MAG: hypothetical protein JSS44_03375 [Proteobacteria bacterium]|nr:hypothetical protein [Pseudomonadota bacterium]MBS0461718.1 hypothetical protein [Pseudomonadota bacterium]MBS0464231.1 hypothetical protein [Pseudomonadota bacterium]
MSAQQHPILRGVATALLLLACGCANASSLEESQCGAITERGGKPEWVSIPKFRVLDYNEDRRFTALTGAPFRGIWCDRSSVIPAPFDYQVLQAGYPFWIRAGDRLAVLEWASHQYRVRLFRGMAISDDEQKHIDERLAAYPPVAEIAANAPKDVAQQGSTTQLARTDAALQPLIEQARRTYPEAKQRFIAGLPFGNIFSVTVRLRDAGGRTEDVFLQVRAIAEGRIYGVIASHIDLVTGFAAGDPYDLPESDIRDWTISKPDGSEEGNLIGKFLDTHSVESL